jgi:hypothetical protein
MQRLREAMEQEQRRVDAEAEAPSAGHPAFEPSFDREPEESLAGSHAFHERSEIAGDLNAGGTAEAPNPIDALLQQEAQRRVHVPSQFAREPGDGAPIAAEEEDASIADEVSKILRRRRWEKRDSPFEGFNSPPGRF